MQIPFFTSNKKQQQPQQQYQQQPQQQYYPPPPPPPVKDNGPLPNGFIAQFDPSTGKTFFVNTLTGNEFNPKP